MAFIFPMFPHEATLQWYELAALTTFIVILTALVLLFFRLIARPNERGWVWAVLGYSGTVLGTLLLFPSHAEFATVVLVVLAFGDSAAEVVGVVWGRRTLPWNGSKTWVGMGGFIVIAGPLAAAAFWWTANPAVGLAVAAPCGIAAAVAGAIAETLRPRISDNFRIGIAAAIKKRLR
jgi:dolichol kinase